MGNLEAKHFKQIKKLTSHNYINNHLKQKEILTFCFFNFGAGFDVDNKWYFFWSSICNIYNLFHKKYSQNKYSWTHYVLILR